MYFYYFSKTLVPVYKPTKKELHQFKGCRLRQSSFMNNHKMKKTITKENNLYFQRLLLSWRYR